MSLEASDSAGFEAFWAQSEAATRRIVSDETPDLKNIVFMEAPPKISDSATDHEMHRTETAPRRRSHLTLKLYGHSAVSNRKAISTPALGPELYPEICQTFVSAMPPLPPPLQARVFSLPHETPNQCPPDSGARHSISRWHP